MQTFPLLFACPLAKGTHVRLTFYRGTAGAPKLISAPIPQQAGDEEPLVEDLDSGVVYAPRWIFSPAFGERQGTRPQVADAPRADLRVHRIVVGTVHACRIVPAESIEAITATYLTIDSGNAPYR